MEAIILAGGFGTRLQSIVNDVPKPMALVCNKPFLEYILSYLSKNGITRVILSVGYKWEIIKKYFGNSFKDTKLIYSIEEEPLGTGGAIKKALTVCKENDIFIINGDTFFDINLKNLELKDHSRIQLSLKPMNNFDRYGCVETDAKGFVTTFTEKSFIKNGNINGGIYLISKNIFDEFSLEEKFSFEKFIQTNFKQLNISTKIFNNYFIDIGIPEDYQKAQIDFTYSNMGLSND
jgi:D-glycero-alpha-D-manno-heptose 1-phosphate guanylyltransferase